jgi:hypothetical protein
VGPEDPEGWIALTRTEVLAGLKRGKRLRRRLAFQARTAQARKEHS